MVAHAHSSVRTDNKFSMQSSKKGLETFPDFMKQMNQIVLSEDQPTPPKAVYEVSPPRTAKAQSQMRKTADAFNVKPVTDQLSVQNLHRNLRQTQSKSAFRRQLPAAKSRQADDRSLIKS